MGPSTSGSEVSTRLAAAAKGTGSWLRDYITAVKSGRYGEGVGEGLASTLGSGWHPFTLVERVARAATRNEPWGPTGTELSALTDLAARKPEDCAIVLAVLELRLGYPPERWRCVYKALLVADHLAKRAPEDALPSLRAAVEDRAAALAQGFGFVDA
ncbi:hypothetical protein H632_c904p0, partial [Helicosporidium sp. ATCC 50920]